ncbi:MAG TPA: hypothetical protein VKY24_22685 [Reyranella sp.]|nr:hypothetical protein [Reyranella sp.]
MTVSSTSSRANYLGDGTTTSFPFAFKVNQPADLIVVYTDAAGNDFPLSPSQYTATGFGVDAGGSVTYPLPGGNPIAAGTKLTIYRDVAVTQPTSLSNQGAMWPQVIEAALDRLTYIAQKVADSVSRSLVISPTDSSSLGLLPNAAQRANSVLAFDGQGQPYAGTLTGSLVSVATWIANTFLPAATPQAACTALQSPYLPGSNAFTGTNDFTGGRAKVPTRPSGDNGTDAASTAFVKAKAESVAGGAVLRSYLAGLGLSNNAATPNTKLDVAAGVCADSTNVQMLSVAASTLDCGTVGANGLDAGSLANGTWYHVFAIGKADGTTALLASTSVTPSLPSGYGLKRRIGSFKTDASAHIVPFSQVGNVFVWKTPPLDQGGISLGTTSTLYALSVPPDVQTDAIFAGSALASGNASVLFQSPDQNTLAVATQGAGSDLIVVSGSAGNGAGGRFSIRTNTARQVRAVASTAVTLTIFTHGWIDRRGRDD